MLGTGVMIEKRKETSVCNTRVKRVRYDRKKNSRIAIKGKRHMTWVSESICDKKKGKTKNLQLGSAGNHALIHGGQHGQVVFIGRACWPNRPSDPAYQKEIKSITF